MHGSVATRPSSAERFRGLNLAPHPVGPPLMRLQTNRCARLSGDPSKFNRSFEGSKFGVFLFDNLKNFLNWGQTTVASGIDFEKILPIFHFYNSARNDAIFSRNLEEENIRRVLLKFAEMKRNPQISPPRQALWRLHFIQGWTKFHIHIMLRNFSNVPAYSLDKVGTAICRWGTGIQRIRVGWAICRAPRYIATSFSILWLPRPFFFCESA